MPQPQVSIQDSLAVQSIGKLWFNRNQYQEYRYFGAFSAAATNEMFVDGISGNRLKLPADCGAMLQVNYSIFNVTQGKVSVGIIGVAARLIGTTTAIGGQAAILAATGDATPAVTVTATADDTNDAIAINAVTTNTDVVYVEAKVTAIVATSPESNFGSVT